MTPSTLLLKAQKAALLVENRFAEAALRRTAERRLANISKPYLVNLGCGAVKFESPWLNVDLDPRADVRCDFTRPLPMENSSCRLIYSEHVFEHFSPEQGTTLMRECHRLLRPGGILRIAMPSLEQLARKYLSPEWREQAWLALPEYESIQTPAEMLNIALRSWGHLWLYDTTELLRRLSDAGFAAARQVAFGESDEPALKSRETRPDSFLICEAVR